MKTLHLVVGIMILGTAYGFLLTAWHRRLVMYLYRKHRPACETLEPSLFERHGFPDWMLWGSWFWPGVRFFICKKYEVLDDSDFQRRAGRFRFALGIYVVMVITVATIAFYLNPH